MPIDVNGYEIDLVSARQHSYDGVVRDGLVLHLDAATFNTVTGTTWYNIANTASYPNGTQSNPFVSPKQAQDLGYSSGTYWFKGGSMTAAEQLEFVPNYYEGKPFCCVFRSPYNSTATTNKLDLAIPMAGFLVQRDTLDLRAAVYWSTPITYATTATSGDNTANSGYSPRRVILGYAGGHGIYTTGQQACNWPNGAGAIGAGWNGSTCGSFPNGLLWGTGQSNTATYTNMSGTWSHWVYWEGGDSGVIGGTLTNGPTYNSGNGGSIVFDGVNDYLSTNYFGDANSSFTFSAWMRPNFTGEHYALGRGSDGNGNGWSITLGTNTDKYRASIVTTNPTVSSVQAFSINNYILNQWVNLTGVWDAGSSIKLYINGQLESTTTTSTTSLRTSTEGWNIGRITTTLYSNTSVANAIVYNRGLTPTEIATNYNALKGRYGL